MLKINRILPKRKKDSHKGTYGRVLIVAGSAGMTGAGVLASRAALRSGSGLVHLAVPKDLVNFVDSLTPEVITLPFYDIPKIEADAVAIGPGIGSSPASKELVRRLATGDGKLVIDADALNAIAKKPSLLKKAKAKIVITPHPGEMSRLIKKSIKYVQANREKVAKQAAKEFKCVVVLKGHQTVVANPAGEVYLNKTGNPGMATAGAGDVLTGMIVSFLGQNISVFDAAALSVYVHGLAGDLAAKAKGEYGMIASDIVEKIPNALQKIS